MTTCLDDVEAQPIAVTLTAGETFKVGMELTDASGAPVDGTGWTWDVNLLDASLSVATPITVTQVAINGFELGITDDITLSLPAADYTWPVRATDTASETRDLFTGLLRVKVVGA